MKGKVFFKGKSCLNDAVSGLQWIPIDNMPTLNCKTQSVVVATWKDFGDLLLTL